MALPVAAGTGLAAGMGDELRLFVGDDWAEDHHDVELMGEDGRVLARARLPESVARMARLHALVAGAVGSLSAQRAGTGAGDVATVLPDGTAALQPQPSGRVG
jgi:hypothetical protein